MNELTVEQRFALQRARYETARMSRPALEKTVIRLLRSRMEQKNGETFVELLTMQEDTMPTSIDDVGYEDDDINDDGLALM